LNSFLASLCIQIYNANPSTFFRQAQGGRQANPCGSTSDHSNFACEIHFASPNLVD
jgi:hypothetical protein